MICHRQRAREIAIYSAVLVASIGPNLFNAYAQQSATTAAQEGHAVKPVVRNHGFQLNEQYRLLIEQVNNTLDIVLIKRNRAESGGLLPNIVTGEETVARYADKKTLAHVQVEVLKPAAPNYLRNPGERYRITLQGVELEPDFKRVVEVEAAGAIKAWQSQFAEFEAKISGVDREAMHEASGLALGVLNVAGHMPAAIPLTVMKSSVGETRGLPQLKHRTLTATREAAQQKSRGGMQKSRPSLDGGPEEIAKP
jgi:hypothetical protein